MTGDHLDDDACLDLVHGVLDADEEARALAHARECGACEERLRAHVATRETLRARETRAREQAATRVPESPRRPGARRAMMLVLPALAAAVLLGILWTSLDREPMPVENAPLAWLPPAGGTLTSRSFEAETPAGDLAEGLVAYADRDLAAAIEHLAAAPAEGRLDWVRRVYLASALAWSGRHAAALEALEPVPLAALPEPWRSEAVWLRLVALGEMGRVAEAEAVRDSLGATPGPLQERARALVAGENPPILR